MAQFIVLGCHRTGTSLVAHLLHKAGVHMGDSLIGPNAHNRAGFFEDEEWVWGINEPLLASVGASWMEPERVMEINPSARLLVEDAIKRREKEHDDWGFKDPRTCFTIPALHPLLPDPHYIVVLRSKEAMARSLEKRGDTSYEGARALYDSYNEAIRTFLRETRPKTALVRYEGLIENPMPNLARLEKFTGRTMDDQIINRNLRHHG